jgi:nucleotide-binding universal stress UspA family protein
MAVEREQAQLLVVGASHLGPLARSVRGDIAAGAAHHAGCAVLVAPAAENAAISAEAPRRIGVAWDGGAESAAALDLAIALAERTGGQLHVVRASGEQDEAAARKALEEVVGEAGDRVPATGELHVGPAAGALVAASKGLDLLVIGARGRTAVAAVTRGSVSTAVHRHAVCPVLVVPHGVHVPVPA